MFYFVKGENNNNEMVNQVNKHLILQYLCKNNMTRHEFVESAGINYTHFHYLIIGSDRVELSVLRKIADKMGCRIKDLFE